MAHGPQQDPIGRGFGAGYAIVGAGFQFAFAIVLFLGGGMLLDRWLGTRPVFTLLGVATGLGAGFYVFLVRVKSASRQETGPQKPES